MCCNTFAASSELAYGQPSHEAPKDISYVTNQLKDNFYVLSGILIEKCSFQAACQFNAKSGAIDQVTLGDQPVDTINLLATPGLFQCLSCISFWLEF